MPTKLYDDIARIGIIKDTPARKLPDGAWSDGRNVRFDSGCAQKVLGSRYVQGSLSTTAYSLFPHTTFDGSRFICYAGLTRVYTVNNNTHYDLTRVSNSSTVVPYNTDSTALWTGGVLGGLLFLNNQTDVPQVQRTPTASCRLSDLPNWPATITTRCSALRAYRNYLVALDVTKGPIRYRQMVKWSAAAEPLTVPSTWDEADPTNDAGEFSLSETNGTVLDCLPLRDVNIIYKDDSVHGMQWIGGTFVFRFYQIFNNVGLLSKRCVCAFENSHCFVGNDLDVYVHNGSVIKSISDETWHKWVRDNIDSANYERMFVVQNPQASEIWFCLPTGEGEYATTAILWNYRRGTWGLRDLPNVSGGAVSAIESTDYLTVWSELGSVSWASYSPTWTELDGLPPDSKLVLVTPDSNEGLIETEFGATELGRALPFELERQGIWTLPSKITDGARAIDLQSRKFINRVRFRTSDENTASDISFMVAVQTDLNDPLVWQTTSKMTNNTAELTIFKRGRFVSVRVESSDVAAILAIEGYEIEYQPSGQYL